MYRARTPLLLLSHGSSLIGFNDFIATEGKACVRMLS